MTDEKTYALIAGLREYATALRASVHVHHTGADLIEHAADAIESESRRADALVEAVVYRAEVIEGYDNSNPEIALEHKAIARDVRRILEDAAVNSGAALTVPDGDARERLVESIAGGTISIPGGYAELAHDDAESIVDTILGDPVLSRAAAPEPEWEYSSRAENGFLYEVTNLEDAELSARNSRQVHGYPGSTTPHLIRHVVRRRKAGPWEPLPVGGETDGE